MLNRDETGPSVIHYFVDEAGDAVLFNSNGHVLVGTEGCSRYFILGKLDVDDPKGLALALDKLRSELMADAYFRGVPSMQPAKKKTAVAFHAKDDLPEVRREVFKVLLAQNVRFYAVVRDKRDLVAYVRQQNERDPKYHYHGNELYDTLVSHLFRSRLYKAEEFRICFSKRGAKDRTAALKMAIGRAVTEFERDFGVQNQAKIDISFSTPAKRGGLQAVDYFLWAVQRFYEYEHTEKMEGEARYIQMLWPLVSEVHDLDFFAEGRRGVFYTREKPLTLENRVMKSAKKKPRI